MLSLAQHEGKRRGRTVAVPGGCSTPAKTPTKRPMKASAPGGGGGGNGGPPVVGEQEEGDWARVTDRTHASNAADCGRKWEGSGRGCWAHPHGLYRAVCFISSEIYLFILLLKFL